MQFEGGKNRIGIVIPCYNGATTIENVVNRIPAELWDAIHSVWIINDGSKDSTASVIDRLSHQQVKIRAVHFARNKGYGAAVRFGLKQIIKHQLEFAVTLHADGQYPPEAIAPCIEILRKSQITLVQGSRIASNTALSGGMPAYKYFAGKILCRLENYIFATAMTDFHSGFIVCKVAELAQCPLEKLSSSFDFDLEVIASLRSRNFEISEYPIPTHYGEEKSYLNPITYGIRVLKVLVQYIFGVYRR